MVVPATFGFARFDFPKSKEDQTMPTPDSLPYVEAELNYIVPMAERPRYYAYDAPPGVQPSNMTPEPHTVRIHDMRPAASEVALDRQGFALVEQRSAVRDFWDEDEVRRVYYPEAERFIAEVTGASRVFIFDHLQRRRVPGAERRAPGVPPQPATRVHVDHTAKSGPQRVRDLLPDEAEELLKGRVQVINLWRPLFRQRCILQWAEKRAPQIDDLDATLQQFLGLIGQQIPNPLRTRLCGVVDMHAG